MRRIAVINQKGGVGKTTTTVNLGAALARLGRRVLVCDLDPQCNLTVHLDVDPAAEQPSLYELLRGEATLEQTVRPTREPNLWVLPSSVDLAGVELELVNVVGREVLLRDAFAADERAHGAPRWDDVLVDCPPSLGLLSLNALVLCDEVLVPVQSEFFALQGLSKLTEIVGLVQRRLNPALRVTGLLSCRHDSSTNLGRQVMDDIRSHFGDVLLATAIRRNVKLAEAPSHGRTIFEYDPESRGAEDYLALAKELLGAAKPAAATPAIAASKPAPAKPTALPKAVTPTIPAATPPVKSVAPPKVAPPPAAKTPRPATPVTRKAPPKRLAASPSAPIPASASPPAAPSPPPAKVKTDPTVPSSAPPAKRVTPRRPAANKPAVAPSVPPATPGVAAPPQVPATRPAPAPAPADLPPLRPAASRPSAAPSVSNGHAREAAPSEPAAESPPAPRRAARRAPPPPPSSASQDP